MHVADYFYPDFKLFKTVYSAYQKTLLVTENTPECISGDANFKNFLGEAPGPLL